MIRYEILLLAVPEITLDEASGTEAQFVQVIKEHNGSLISFERWGKYRLAYPIKRAEYGVYFLVRFEAEAKRAERLLSAIRSLVTLKYNEIIMRHLVTHLPKQRTLVYQRPESLEDTPSRVDSAGRSHRTENEGYGTRGRGDDYGRSAMTSLGDDELN